MLFHAIHTEENITTTTAKNEVKEYQNFFINDILIWNYKKFKSIFIWKK